MPDRALKRPVRRDAAAALVVSLLAHVLLILGLWLVPGESQEEVPPPPENELVVIVGGTERGAAKGKGIDVTLSDNKPIAPVEAGPSRMQPRILDDPPPSTEQSPVSAANTGGIDPDKGSTRPGEGNSGELAAGGGPSFFQVSATGKTVVYVLDRSMSMGPSDALRQAKAELLASLNRLPATVQFQVIAYNQIAEPLAVHNYCGWLTPDAETLAEVAGAVSLLRATGRTNHVQALLRGLALRPDVLFLATDADDLTANDLATVMQYNGKRCSIHVIDFSSRPDEPGTLLRRLAEQNRGTYRRVAVKEF